MFYWTTNSQHVLGSSLLRGRNRSGAEGLARDSGMRPWAEAGADGILEVRWSVPGRLETAEEDATTERGAKGGQVEADSLILGLTGYGVRGMVSGGTPPR